MSYPEYDLEIIPGSFQPTTNDQPHPNQFFDITYTEKNPIASFPATINDLLTYDLTKTYQLRTSTNLLLQSFTPQKQELFTTNFTSARGLTFDSANNIYVTYGNSTNGYFVGSWASDGNENTNVINNSFVDFNFGGDTTNYNPWGLIFNNDGTKLFVCCQGQITGYSGLIKIYNNDGTFDSNLNITNPKDVVYFTRNSIKYLLVTTNTWSTSSTVTLYNLMTNTQTPIVTLSSYGWGLAIEKTDFAATENLIFYVTTWGTSTTNDKIMKYTYDFITATQNWSVTSANNNDPYDVFYYNKMVWVTNYNNSQISVLNTDGTLLNGTYIEQPNISWGLGLTNGLLFITRTGGQISCTNIKNMTFSDNQLSTKGTYTLGVYNTITNIMIGSTTLSLTVNCYVKGTKILCLIDDEEKYIKIENIKKGMLIKTYKHGYKKVILKGINTILNTTIHTFNKIYVMKKEINSDLIDDLYVCGQHSILVDNLTESQIEKSLKKWSKILKIDDKYLLMAYVNENFEEVNNDEMYTIYHLVLENEDPKKKLWYLCKWYFI